MRVYLVVIDESEETHNALRFAARRAADTEGAVHLLGAGAEAGVQRVRRGPGDDRGGSARPRPRSSPTAPRAS
jgi:hypothetical protein